MAILKSAAGTVFKGVNYTVVKKVGKKGEVIPKHNHPEANVLFTAVKGKVKVQIGEEVFCQVPGEIIEFDGREYISAEFLEAGEVFVTLILK